MKKQNKQKSKLKSSKKSESRINNAFLVRDKNTPFAIAETKEHVFGNSLVCSTDSRGHKTPRNRNPLEIVLDASEGFIPLWAEDVTLRWRFNEPSMGYFQNPTAAKREIKKLFATAVDEWGDAAPINFSERNDAWDFEVVMRNSDNCNSNGCTLASAFFPDSGRHQLTVYPKMFTQTREEQIETFIHEIGHIFGLRHFFANVSEKAWPSEIFGEHEQFTIMNYGSNSMLTSDDRSDLKSLYQQVWGGDLTKINGTRIVKVTPFHRLGEIH